MTGPPEDRSIPPFGPLEARLGFFLGNALVVIAVDDFGSGQLMAAVELAPARAVLLERLGGGPGLGYAEPLRQFLLAVVLVPLRLIGGEAAQDTRAVLVGGPEAEV